MGNTWTMEIGSWHGGEYHDIKQEYKPKTPSEGVYQDMNHPLPHYFISAGHNSYLTSDQLLGACGTQTIKQCLRQACRVIELDCYNASSGYDGPLCKHGPVTKPVLFKECVIAIREEAFVRSPYPVIITIENHTDHENQRAMVSILKEVLGEQLFVPRPEDHLKEWKSPEELKYKVLIRSNLKDCCQEYLDAVYIRNVSFKSLHEANASSYNTSSSFVEGKITTLTEEMYEHSGLPQTGVKKSRKAKKSKRYRAALARRNQHKEDHTWRNRSSAASKKADNDEDNDDNKDEDKKAGQEETRKDSTEENEEDVDAEALARDGNMQDFYKYTSRHLMRVYPSGTRVDSSNYDPSHAWALGASIVALNWQSWIGIPLFINEAQFSQNGGCGYVLKPQWMFKLDPRDGVNPLPSREPVTLRVTLFCAHAYQPAKNFLCLKDDLYVRLELRGMPIDCQAANSYLKDNTGRLKLDQEFIFTVKYPELANLAIIIKDDDVPGSGMDDTLGTCAVNLNTLRTGYYHMCVRSESNKPRSDRWVKVAFDWLEQAKGLTENVSSDDVDIKV